MPLSARLRRLALAFVIDSDGSKILPCSTYSKANLRCYVAKGYSTRYSEYIRQGFAKCDITGINIGSLLALRREAERLRAEEDAILEKAAALTA